MRKRSRDSGGGDGTLRAHRTGSAVGLDSAFPSGRVTTGHYGPSSASTKTEEEDVQMENSNTKRGYR